MVKENQCMSFLLLENPRLAAAAGKLSSFSPKPKSEATLPRGLLIRDD